VATPGPSGAVRGGSAAPARQEQAEARRFAAALGARAAETEAMLERCLPAPGPGAGEAELAAAMRHAVLGGGKRLRAFLAIETAGLFGIAGAPAARLGAALECLHAYSLVHDDLPCMDDDDLRRGRPTVHKAWDEATAVLAGDALQTLAFEILAAPATHDDAAVRARLCLGLAEAAGAGGMVGGQALDLAAETGGAALGEAGIRRLQAMKTGALIRFAAEAGAILGAAPEADRARIRAYAGALGAAFQIADDLLDIAGSETETGKRVGKDRGAGKATLLDILGPEGARAEAEALAAKAAEALAPYGPRAALLAAAATFTINRRA